MINPSEQKDFAGKNGFIWWTGVVEDRKDPIKLGRCRVRCIGWHNPNKMQLPTDALPWATPSIPINMPNVYTPREGDMVFGFFLDGENAQEPVMLGMFPGIPLKDANPKDGFNDPRTSSELSNAPVKPKESAKNYPRKLDEPTTSRLARNDAKYPSEIVQDKKSKKESKVEPDPYYKAQYPYNNVYESESGHALEFDDTKGAERVHLYHRSGSYTEWGPEGDRAERIQRNKFEVVIGNEQVYVKGDVTVYIDGNATVEVGKNLNATVKGNLTGKVNGNLSADVGGSGTVKIGSSCSLQTGGSFSAKIGGSCTIESGGSMKFTAPRIDIN
jgi:hypothetical protein